MQKSERELTLWGIVCENNRGIHFAGQRSDGVWQVSSPVAEFDADTLTGKTESGRPYRLVGPAMPSAAMAALKELWGRHYDLAGSTFDVIEPEELDRRLNGAGVRP